MEEEQELREKIKSNQIVPTSNTPPSLAVKHRLWPEVNIIAFLCFTQLRC